MCIRLSVHLSGNMLMKGMSIFKRTSDPIKIWSWAYRRDQRDQILMVETKTETRIIWVSMSRPRPRLNFKSLNVETDTETKFLQVSVSRLRPRLNLHSLNVETETETKSLWVSMSRPRPRLNLQSLNVETETETEFTKSQYRDWDRDWIYNLYLPIFTYIYLYLQPIFTYIYLYLQPIFWDSVYVETETHRDY